MTSGGNNFNDIRDKSTDQISCISNSYPFSVNFYEASRLVPPIGWSPLTDTTDGLTTRCVSLSVRPFVRSSLRWSLTLRVFYSWSYITRRIITQVYEKQRITQYSENEFLPGYIYVPFGCHPYLGCTLICMYDKVVCLSQDELLHWYFCSEKRETSCIFRIFWSYGFQEGWIFRPILLCFSRLLVTVLFRLYCHHLVAIKHTKIRNTWTASMRPWNRWTRRYLHLKLF